MSKSKSVKVYWMDAVIYSASSIRKKLELKPNKKITEGVLEKDGEWGVVVKDPHTINGGTSKRDHREEMKKKATFLFIPHGMIEKIEK